MWIVDPPRDQHAFFPKREFAAERDADDYAGCCPPHTRVYQQQWGSVEDHPPNPKQRYGDLKPNLALVPGVAIAHEALAFENGAAKYGAYNWRDKAVEAMTYVAANMRHVQAWLDGEEYSVDTTAAGKPVHNLAHARASLGILLDCIEQGNLIDNRPIAGKTSAMHERVKEQRQRIDVV